LFLQSSTPRVATACRPGRGIGHCAEPRPERSLASRCAASRARRALEHGDHRSAPLSNTTGS
jgi:hypothetical protein